MYQIDNSIRDQPVHHLQVRKFLQEPGFEILSISLEAGATFPEHTSPRDALLLVLQGSIELYINDSVHALGALQSIRFEKEVPHHVVAQSDARFLIIR